LTDYSVLLLNANGQPLSILPLSTISWQTAVKALFAHKVHTISNFENKFLRSTTISIPYPSIVMLNAYHRQPNRAKFTRRNVYIRDNYKCQYCNEQFFAGELTLDHVIPRSKGGKLTWDNTVSACGPCNVKKADRMIRPLNKPVVPSWHYIQNSNKHHTLHIPDMSWQDYVKWPEDKLILLS
jgi:5-methylcytosine-specific restriction endonuclease McrA